MLRPGSVKHLRLTEERPLPCAVPHRVTVRVGHVSHPLKFPVPLIWLHNLRPGDRDGQERRLTTKLGRDEL